MVDDPTDVLARLEAALAKLDELRDTPLPCARIRAELLALPCQVLREQVESTARLARAAKAADREHYESTLAPLAVSEAAIDAVPDAAASS